MVRVYGYEDYFVTRNGNIYSCKFNRIKKLSACPNSKGYLTVNLYKNGVRNTVKVHQIVAKAFLNHNPSGCTSVVDHIDNNKSNNCVYNLQILSHEQNSSKSNNKHPKKLLGVRYISRHDKWTSYIRINGKSTYLGTFDNELDAHSAYISAKNNKNK